MGILVVAIKSFSKKKVNDQNITFTILLKWSYPIKKDEIMLHFISRLVISYTILNVILKGLRFAKL